MSSSFKLACLKRQDQGNHECEVLADGAEGALHWKKCTKNPGHRQFIPSKDFSFDHLPKEYQDKQVFEYIRYLSELTVKITVAYTSPDRPDGYPFFNFRGQYINHTGSGCVRSAFEEYKHKMLNKSCPCQSCVDSGEPKKRWWRCTVITAKHVVFNSEEARHAVIEAFYEDDERRDQVRLLYGVEVIDDNMDGDRCEFSCVTHDKMLADQLRYASDVSLNLHRTFSRGCYPTLGQDKANLCVVVSHPHGCKKYITIGHWKDCHRQVEDTILDDSISPGWHESYFAYTYDTPTCPGSSGGSMLILGLWNSCWTYILAAYYFCHTHSSGKVLNGENLNQSSYWLIAAE